MKFAALIGKVAEPILFAIWDEQLGDIPAAQLNAACDRLMKTWRFPNLPLPGDVRAQLDKADAKALELEAAGAWDRLLAWVREWYHPDLGIIRGAPALDAATEHAARAAGGYRWLESCPESELQWARKRFLESFGRIHELGQEQNLLTRDEARKILAEIAKPSQQRPELPAQTEGGERALPVPR